MVSRLPSCMPALRSTSLGFWNGSSPILIPTPVPKSKSETDPASNPNLGSISSPSLCSLALGHGLGLGVDRRCVQVLVRRVRLI
jgi:hypothetical protein